jgi:hypothetical protein
MVGPATQNMVGDLVYRGDVTRRHYTARSLFRSPCLLVASSAC